MTGDDKESGGRQRCIPQELATGMLVLEFVCHKKAKQFGVKELSGNLH
jgi:hypothetical protein